MAKETIFQRLNGLFANSKSVPQEFIKNPVQYRIPDDILYSTNDKEEYDRKLTQYKQQKLLSFQWVKAGADAATESLAGYTAVKLMYRDSDLMDGTPEIGAALDIVEEEACSYKSDGQIIHVYSKSSRVKAVLEDLFINRLQIHMTLPMICRSMCKYGNTFMLLNVNKDNGILGWRQLPVYEIDRIENGYGTGTISTTSLSVNDLKPDETRFVWVGHNENLPYPEWQIAHFRLLSDSFFYPYGVSMLHKARRAWRMWSMMEDAMLIHRLDKSVERRVYKVYVGGIDDKDVPAFVQEIANNFKRTPVIDPLTGQIDLRKNFIDVSGDYFIPVRTENAATPIENLQGANSELQMSDIEYMQSKVFAALRVPKTFLNFQEAQGKGQNLSIMDVRFSRMVNRIQQFLLVELNKIAMTHLFLMGLEDEVTNFSLSMNNPSSQIEALELEDLNKRVTLAAQALADPGNGIPVMSLHKVLKDIMKMSDSEIKDMLNEMRLETAMAAELKATTSIIKKTGMFDPTDRIYGDYDAMNNPNAQQMQGGDEEGNMGGGGMPSGLGGGLGIGDDIDMPGGPDDETEGDIGGEATETDMSNAPDLDSGNSLMEMRKQKVMKESKSFTQQYFEHLINEQKIVDNEEDMYDFEVKNTLLEDKMKKIISDIENI